MVIAKLMQSYGKLKQLNTHLFLRLTKDFEASLSTKTPPPKNALAYFLSGLNSSEFFSEDAIVGKVLESECPNLKKCIHNLFEVYKNPES